MNIKIINAGKCMMCGNEIRLVTNKNYDKLPEIFFCPKCSRKIKKENKMNDESRAKLIMSIHKLVGVPLSEATKAYDLIIEYFRLKSNIGDHPEKCKPREYILVEKKISEDTISRQEALDLGYDMSEIDGEHFTEPCMVVDVEDIQKLPSVTPKQEPCETIVILDKIRTEIVACLKALDNIEKSRLNIYLPNEMTGRRLTYQQCLEFIDKYKEESEGKESCDNCKHNTDSWDSDACDGCCEANSKWSGEIYPGEFEAMEHNGRMDALVSEEISREEIAALLARGSEGMTREEAIKTLVNIRNSFDSMKENTTRFVNAYNMAIAALEAEPCSDAISRQEAIDAFSMFAEYESNRTNAEWVDRIRVVLSSLPPVQPIRPRGHWINKEVTDEYGVVGNCSECKERRIIDNFCPSCGADMRE